MEHFTPYSALIGGGLIGLAATMLLVTHGRIAGISGIMNGIRVPSQGDSAWRMWFLIGLIAGGAIYSGVSSPEYEPRSGFPISLLVLAGLMVGFGTRMGNGCTSGHAVCGLARLSLRSLVATAVFLLTGVITVALVSLYWAGS